jgi:hypothetical protein
MTSFRKFALLFVFAAFCTASSFTQTLTPQGRLTLVSNTPVMTSDVVNATTVYYTPYVGSYLPACTSVCAGSWAQFNELTLTLNASHQLAGNIYDLFVFQSGASLVLGANSVPWPSINSRGSGFAQLHLVSGIWTSATGTGSSLYYNGTTGYSDILNPVYVGSIYMTGDGETSMQFKPAAAAGGSNPILGLYNAYNRVRVTSEESDSNSSWTYNSPSVQPADNNSNNSIRLIDGLAQSRVEGEYCVNAEVVPAPAAAAVARIGFNGLGSTGLISYTTSTIEVPLCAKGTFQTLGLIAVQALENAGSGGSTATYQGGGAQLLKASLEM